MAGVAYDITNRQEPIVNPEREAEKRAKASGPHVSNCSKGGAHHIRIATPNGSRVKGTCIKCETYQREYETAGADNYTLVDSLSKNAWSKP